LRTSGIVALFILYICLSLYVASRSDILLVLAIVLPAIIAPSRGYRRDARIWLLLSLVMVLVMIAVMIFLAVSHLDA
jgi:hypothetical protein